MTDTLSSNLPAGKLAEFKGLFYSKEEWQQIGEELKEEGSGWKGAVKAKLQLASISKIKDPLLLEDFVHRLAVQGLDFEQARFAGVYTSDAAGVATLDLVVRCKQPSLIYRFLFDDHVDVPLRVRCWESSGTTVLTVEHLYKQAFDLIGCGITVILLFAFVLPGIVWLYLTRSARKVRGVVQKDVVFAALTSRLQG